ERADRLRHRAQGYHGLRQRKRGGSRMFWFAGRKALVTGGGRGIGRAIALALTKQGADVAIAARGRDELEHVAGEIRAHGRKASVHVVDMGDTRKAVE